MKTFILGLLTLAVGTIGVRAAENENAKEDDQPKPSTPVIEAPAAAAGSDTRYHYEQQPPPGRAPLVSPEQAQSIIDRFKAVFPDPGRPRFLIFVNRELVETQPGLHLTSRKETVQTRRQQETATRDGDAPASDAAATRPSNINVNAGGDVGIEAGDRRTPGRFNSETEVVRRENRYRVRERTERTLADRQTVRDVERLFGRPLRMAGAALVDQRVATDLIGDRDLEEFLSVSDDPQATRDREAIRKIADVVLEVLVSSREVTVVGLSGDRVYRVPDIQATAIRLEDFQIIGQATSADAMGTGQSEGQAARSYSVPEITEATALALMEDMLISAPPR